MSRCFTPKGDRASIIAPTIAGVAPIVPASPTPLTPRGFTGDGVSVRSNSNQGTYEFTRHQLKLKYDDGTTKTVDAFGTDDKDKPPFLGIDGKLYDLFGH